MVYNIHGGHNPSGKIACEHQISWMNQRKIERLQKQLLNILKKQVQQHIIVQLVMEEARQMCLKRFVQNVTSIL